MSLWRKRGTSDTVATDVHHNEQKPDHLVNIVTNLSIQSDDLSIKREKAMREVQRLGQEIEQEPVAWLYRDSWGTMKLSQITPPPVGAFPVYTTPPQRTWVDLTDDEMLMIYGQKHEGKKYSLGCMVQAKLKEKNK